MGRWLAALRDGVKTTNNAPEANPQNPQNSPGRSFVGFEGSYPEAFSNFHHPGWSGWDGEDWATAFDERAAILEFDEGLTRSEASRIARQEINERRRAKWN